MNDTPAPKLPSEQRHAPGRRGGRFRTTTLSVQTVQIIRKIVLGIALVIGLGFFSVTAATAAAGSLTHKLIEWGGISAMVICICGRGWCAMYIGGRKYDELVSVGPYSVCRNPLYVFSVLGAVGIGAQIGSIVMGLVFGALTWLVFYAVVLQEERVMAARFSADFLRYMATVPRFLPNPRLWRDVSTLTVSPPIVVRTFEDAMILLLAVPFAKIIELLQNDGIVPVLFHLP